MKYPFYIERKSVRNLTQWKERLKVFPISYTHTGIILKLILLHHTHMKLILVML